MAFAGGLTSGFTAGAPLNVQYVDPTGTTRETQLCWSPAPIDQPACSTNTTAAPAQAGTQTITAQLSNGASVSRTLQIGPAATQLGSGSTASPPVPYTVTCSTQLYGNYSDRKSTRLNSSHANISYAVFCL